MTAVRAQWTRLPTALHRAVESHAEARVAVARNQPGGFTPGLAARLRFDDGQGLFVKAIETTDFLASVYRAEARYARGLPPDLPVPRLRFTEEVDGWFLLAFDDLDGRHPSLDDPADLDAVLRTVDALHELLTPSPVAEVPAMDTEYRSALTGWRSMHADGPPDDLDPWARQHLGRLADLEAAWSDAARGDTLLHADLRPDNMVRTLDGRVWVVDWAEPCVGAPCVDLLILLASVAATGRDPEPIVTRHPMTATPDRRAVDAIVCALAGYWAVTCRKPPPPRSPRLREHQRRYATTASAWLRRRTGW